MNPRISFASLILLFLIITLSTLTPLAKAGLYTVPLANNTIYADDFENYASNQVLGCSTGTQAALTQGWGYVDCSAGFMSNITSTNYYSCCKSIETGSPSAANGIGDVDKRFAVFNSTRFVQMSLWFAMNNRYIFENGNNAHISIETWTKTDRLEAAIFLLSRNSTDTACTTGAGIEIDWVGSPNSNGLPQTDHLIPNYCLPVFNPAAGGNAGLNRAVWHHLMIRIDLQQKDWDGLEVDGISFDSTVRNTFMYAHAGGTDNEFANFNPFPVRFEIGAANGVTHTTPIDTWNAWHDDLIISDVTGGPSTCGPLCLSAINLSAWFGILMVTVGAGTSSSLYFGAARMLRGEPFKSKEVVALLAAGALGVLAFGVMMAVAVGLIKIIPGG